MLLQNGKLQIDERELLQDIDKSVSILGPLSLAPLVFPSRWKMAYNPLFSVQEATRHDQSEAKKQGLSKQPSPSQYPPDD